MHFQATTTLSLFAGLVSAITAPARDGFTIVWQDGFAGPPGSSVNADVWNVAQAIDTNNEVQQYTGSNINLQISGGDTVQFVPRKATSGTWTSGRIETKASYMAEPGKIMLVESLLRVGSNGQANKQGVWPAFWMLGDSIRHGTEWPQSGELDIFEQVNGVATGYGTVHCGSSSGGPCNEPTGRGAGIGMDDGWHTWSMKIDRTSGDWTQETITWLKDGVVYNTLTGATIGDQGVWGTLAQSPMYILMNVAVGGDWPGAPNADTLDGYEAGMEVSYVSVYYSV